jgi:hypothetical protein
VSLPPVIYLGPSLPRDEALAILPDAHIRPPVRRGDLYRDRMLRYSVFVVIDGLFFQHGAVSPREVIDVLEDGALVIGAASMGALRASECWPAGMLGVGVIYRLFRAGRLLSDDEVAIAVDPDAPQRALSVALVNIRHALGKAVRAGLLEHAAAQAIAEVAAQTHYAERRWQQLLHHARVADEDGAKRRFLERHDLKRDDAARALRRTAALLAKDPALALRPRKHPRPFVLPDESRERSHDAFAGMDPRQIQRAVCREAIASGRYQEHLLALVVTHRLWPALLEGSSTARAGIAPRADADAEGLDRYAVAPQRLPLATDRRRVLEEVWRSLPEREDEIAEALWAELVLSGRVDAAVYRWRALRMASAEARARGWTATALHRHAAESEIAHAHGSLGWSTLEDALRRHEVPWSWVTAYRDELALAKRIKDALFREGLAWRDRGPERPE